MKAHTMVRIAALVAAAAVAPSGARAQQQPTPITFDAAVRVAVERSTELARARNQNAALDLSVAEAGARFLPQLRLSLGTSGSYNRALDDLGGTAAATSRSANAGIGASVTLFDGFANVADLRGSRLAADAGAGDTQRAAESVVFSVVSGFLGLVETREQAKVASENLETEERRESEVAVLVEAGSRPIADLYQQRATVATARAAVVDAERALELQRLELIQTLRLDPTGSFDFVTPADQEVGPSAALELGALVETALARRADLAAAGARVSAADQEVRAAGASRWPSVSLSASYGTNASDVSDDAFLTQLDQRQSASLGVSVSLPVFDGGSASRSIQRAELAADDARLAEDALRQGIALDIRRALLDRRSAEAALAAAEARVTAASQALAVTEQRYAAGVSTLFEVAQTRAAYVAAASASVRARYTLLFQDSVLRYYTGELTAPEVAT